MFWLYNFNENYLKLYIIAVNKTIQKYFLLPFTELMIGEIFLNTSAFIMQNNKKANVLYYLIEWFVKLMCEELTPKH
jgi:hypothetical protein